MSGISASFGLAGCINQGGSSGQLGIYYLLEVPAGSKIWTVADFPFSEFEHFDAGLANSMEIVTEVEAGQHAEYPDLAALHGMSLPPYNVSISEINDIIRAFEPVPFEEVRIDQERASGILRGWLVRYESHHFCITPVVIGG